LKVERSNTSWKRHCDILLVVAVVGTVGAVFVFVAVLVAASLGGFTLLSGLEISGS
jgi:hypothetical protein